MATDMIRLAWVDNYDVAVLLSSDKDFVPVAEFLETRGIKVIHGAFPPRGAELTRKCWSSIDVAGFARGIPVREIEVEGFLTREFSESPVA